MYSQNRRKINMKNQGSTLVTNIPNSFIKNNESVVTSSVLTEISNVNAKKCKRHRMKKKNDLSRTGSAFFSAIPVETKHPNNKELLTSIIISNLSEADVRKAPKYTVKNINLSNLLLTDTVLKVDANGLVNAGRTEKDGIVFFYNQTNMNLDSKKVDVKLNNKGNDNQILNKTHLFLTYYYSPTHIYKIRFNTLPFEVHDTTSRYQIMSNYNVFMRLSHAFPLHLTQSELLLINSTILFITRSDDSSHTLNITNLTEQIPTKHFTKDDQIVTIGKNKECSYYLSNTEVSNIHVEITYINESATWLIKDGSRTTESKNETWIITGNNEYTIYDDMILKIDDKELVFNIEGAPK